MRQPIGDETDPFFAARFAIEEFNFDLEVVVAVEGHLGREEGVVGAVCAIESLRKI